MTEYYCYDAPDGHHKTCIHNTAKKIVLQRIPARGVTLTIGVFFDGTGNNVENTNLRLEQCKPERYGLNAHELATFSEKCIAKKGYRGTRASSYLGYYTNIHLLNTLYQQDEQIEDNVVEAQRAVYIEGVGTQNKKPDSKYGMAFGNNETGVIAKTTRAIEQIKEQISIFINKNDMKSIAIAKIQFDIFGFSRGAAAARHFANRVNDEDPALVEAIKAGLSGYTQHGKPAGEIRFIGPFDTVAAVAALSDGLDPHDSNNHDVKLELPPGIAKHVFHITAMHECRYNFCLNSIKEVWPELSLPGVHSDIGGGYKPEEPEYYFLTRPEIETVPENTPEQATQVYRNASVQSESLFGFPSLAPLLPSGVIKVECNSDDRMSPDRYNNFNKKVGAAVTFERTVSNDWSKVVLRVMYEISKDVGVLFEEIQESDKFSICDELRPFCEKAVSQGKAIFTGSQFIPFTSEEINIIGKYIHCSANWNAVDYDSARKVTSGARASAVLSFINRPDTNWRRTVYNMKGDIIS
ncbi:T6SS phospholipase effector Tle1-like catalytic domain-containing protein [Enterobacter hormaechei]|uniref:T6SS phospholipase effector Tle1-like catalytic domain-containing protein n=1 Tax=Enterobacter hormaechei TaxID=158836 RepID=UPI0032ED2085